MSSDKRHPPAGIESKDDDLKPATTSSSLDELLKASSLGTAAARRLRERVPPETASLITEWVRWRDLIAEDPEVHEFDAEALQQLLSFAARCEQHDQASIAVQVYGFVAGHLLYKGAARLEEMNSDPRASTWRQRARTLFADARKTDRSLSGSRRAPGVSDTSKCHVVPSPGGGWDVKRPDAERASAHADTRADAVALARQIVRHDGGGEVVIHDSKGAIRVSETVTHGSDLEPPRGR